MCKRQTNERFMIGIIVMEIN